jgi:ATP-dependent Clp protease ATP-binding subunit ClpX
MTARELQIVEDEDRQPPVPRELAAITPPVIFEELSKGVLGQDRALRFVAVAIYKHTSARSSGSILLVGNSGTGKTTIMNNIQRLYDSVPEYLGFRVMTILNANLLVDGERAEFRGDRLLAAVEQRARTLLGPRPSPAELTEAMERATICIDEIDKMTTLVLGRANPVGVVVQQGLLTLMEGGRVPYRTRAWSDGAEEDVTLEIETRRMMFICGGAFEGLYDQVRERVSQSGELQKMRTETIRLADGRVRIMERFNLAQFLKPNDLFTYGMVPQFISRFDKLVLLDDLAIATLKQILLEALDSPFVLSRRDFARRGIQLEIDGTAASMLAERAAREPRSGARALRDLFAEVINPFEFDPESGKLEALPDGSRRLVIDAETVRTALG